MSPRISATGQQDSAPFVTPPSSPQREELSSASLALPIESESRSPLIEEPVPEVPALSGEEESEHSPPSTPSREELPSAALALPIESESRSPLIEQPTVVPVLPIEARSEHSPPSPPQNLPQRYYNFWGQEISRMEKQSQLSTMQTVCNLAYKSLWGIVAIPKRLLSITINKTLDVVTQKATEAIAVKGVGLIHTPEPHTLLKQLHDCFKYLTEITSHEASVYIKVSPEQREQASKIVDDFLLRQKTYLEESYDPQTGFKMSLDYAQESKFRTLSQALKNNMPLDGPFIKNLYGFIEKCWKSQQQFHVKKSALQLLGKATTNAITPVAPHQTERKEPSRFYETLTSVAPKPIPPTNAIPLISEQIDNLKSLGFKIGLALLILPENILHQPNEQNGGLLTTLIEKSEKALDPLKDSNEIFQNLIFTALDNSDLNFVQRTWKKFLCILFAPSVLFIVDHLLEQSKDLVLYLIGISPEERLKLIFKMFIEPGREFISKLQAEYLSLAQNAGKIQTTPERAISNAIANIKIKDRNLKDLTPKDLINRLVSALINQYAPSLNWASAATEHFEKRAQKALPLFVIVFTGLSYLSWVINIVTAPPRWCLHKVVRKILKMVAVHTLHSKLSDSSDSSWDFGKLALNSLYKTLLHKLGQKNRKGVKAAEREKRNLAIEQTAFVDKDIQDNIHKLVSSFLKLLYIQGSDLIGLSQKLAPNNNVEQTKLAAMDLILAPGVQKATEQIIHGLQTFLQEELFSAGVLEVLQDIAQQCRHINSGRTKESSAPIEQAFYTELQDAVKSGIQEAIDEKLDPSKHIQEEADLFIDGLKHDVAHFTKEFQALPTLGPSDINEIAKKRTILLFDVFKRRFERARDSTNRGVIMYLEAISEKFYDRRKPISEKINNLVNLNSELKKTNDLTEELQLLIPPLKKATLDSQPLTHATKFYSELQLTLQKVKNNRYPKSVQHYILMLQKSFELWRTEAEKKNNHSNLDGIIETIREEVDRAIQKNKTEVDKLLKQIQDEHQQTAQDIAVLVQWADTLTHFKVETADINLAQQFFAQHASSIPGGLSPLILKQLDAFFQFLGKDHNIKGLLWYVIKAYLETPSKSRPEFEKILIQVRQKIPSLKAPSNKKS